MKHLRKKWWKKNCAYTLRENLDELHIDWKMTNYNVSLNFITKN